MTKVLSSRGYNVLKDSLSNDDLIALKKELTVTPSVLQDYTQGKPSSFKVYQESSSRIYIPKYYGLKKFGIPDVYKLQNGDDISLAFVGSLRDYQVEASETFLTAAKNKRKMGGLLNVYCGWGKTTVAIYILCKLAKKTLIICHKDFLLEQWKERIEQFAPGARIGLIKAKVIDVNDKDVILASLQSLSMKDYSDDVFNGIGLVICDEVHHFSAEVFSQALKKITFEYALGLSATMNRKDGLSKVFKWYLGDVVYKATKRMDELRVHFHEFYDPNPRYSVECKAYNNKLNITRMINNICEYKPRLDFLIKTLVGVLQKEPERKVIVLSDRKQHLRDIHETLAQCYGYESAFYVGGMKQDALKESEQKQIILATYHIAAEGFDCPGLDTLVLGSPKSDVIQCVGRIQRTPQHARKHVPIVIDIIDNFSIFTTQARKRLKFYKSCKYDIVGEHCIPQNNGKVILKGPSFIDEK